MTAKPGLRRLGACLVLAALSLALAACLLTPGKFTSELDVRRNGTFRFAYTGEMHLLALSEFARNQGEAADATFTAQCYSEDDEPEERACTDEEIAEQREAWEQAKVAGERRRKEEAEQMKAILGGIDPSDPQAAEELAARMRRQAGWKRVDYRGDGLFEVAYEISGRIDHDFVFPTIERFPTANVFVSILRRADGTVRVEAPAFGPAQNGDPFRGMMGAAASEGDGAAPNKPVAQGTFTLTTDAAILANNTDEGPQPAHPAGNRLTWQVGPREPTHPTALLRLNAAP
jgi:hypothetical protein